MIVIGETDAISHRLWKYHDRNSPFRDDTTLQYRGEDPVYQIYRRLDTYLGKLCRMVGPDTTTIIMSDHGHGGNTTKAVYLNCWLEQQKFLGFRSSSDSNKAVSLFKGALAANLQWAKTNALKFLPPNFKKKLLRKTNLASKIESALRFSNIDWSQTRAYSEETPYFPTIWINMQGREPDGTVRPGKDYEQVREQIIRELYRWSDPETGKRVVTRVHRREDLYLGPFVEKFPDLIIEWNLDNGYSYLFKNSGRRMGRHLPIARVDEKERNKCKSGDHRDTGIFIAFGENIKTPLEWNGAELMDLAPTILHLLGLPIPADMDGRILSEVLEDEYLGAHPVCYGAGTAAEVSPEGRHPDYSEEEEDAIKERLRGLGYIE
jgi:predicted AlkP superfamily phosphohydrolase/phosphomutase